MILKKLDFHWIWHLWRCSSLDALHRQQRRQQLKQVPVDQVMTADNIRTQIDMYGQKNKHHQQNIVGSNFIVNGAQISLVESSEFL